MSKTHFAIGLATSLAVVQPKSFNECLVAVIGGTVGGVLADNDTLDNDYHSDALIGQILALGTTIFALAIDYFFHLGIFQSINEQKTWSIIGFIAFIILYFFGYSSDHRTFTHSLTALIAYTIAVSFIHVPIAIGFSSAYLSHLILDIMNKKKIPILYPLNFGICFKICYANKIADKIFMCIGFIISGVLLLTGIITSCTT